MNSWLCLQVVSVKYVTVPGSSHMEFSLLAVKATWFHLFFLWFVLFYIYFDNPAWSALTLG